MVNSTDDSISAENFWKVIYSIVHRGLLWIIGIQ